MRCFLALWKTREKKSLVNKEVILISSHLHAFLNVANIFDQICHIEDVNIALYK